MRKPSSSEKQHLAFQIGKIRRGELEPETPRQARLVQLLQRAITQIGEREGTLLGVVMIDVSLYLELGAEPETLQYYSRHWAVSDALPLMQRFLLSQTSAGGALFERIDQLALSEETKNRLRVDAVGRLLAYLILEKAPGMTHEEIAAWIMEQLL